MDQDKLFTPFLEIRDFFMCGVVSTIAMNFTQLILQKCCKTITGTDMTFQDAFTFNGTLHTE